VSDPRSPTVLQGADDVFDVLKRRWLTLIVALVLAVVGIQWFRHSFYDQGYAPEQPIPFSHQQHAGDLHIDCKYCHFNADRGKHAGVPPMATCLGCHGADKGAVRADRPTIKKLLEIADKRSYDDETGVAHDGGVVHWKRVHKLPDFVYFSHQWHVGAGVACQTCHGPIETMPIVRQHATLTMGWCLDCHRSTNYVSKPSSAPGYPDPAAFKVGTFDYDIQRTGRFVSDANATFNERKTMKPEAAHAAGDGHAHAPHGAADPHAPAAGNGAMAGPRVKAPAGVLPNVPIDSPFGVHGQVTAQQQARLEELFAKHPAWKDRIKDLPRWRIADLPESHRAYYYKSDDELKRLVAAWSGAADPTDEQIRSYIVRHNFVNSPTQCSTCHQ